MTDTNEPAESQSAVPPPYEAAPAAPEPVPAMAGGAMAAPYAVAAGPVGKIRSTGTCVLLSIVTLGFYTWYWWYKTHDEMKRHSGEGIGGGIALLLAILVSIVMPFLTSNEVGKLYERDGKKPPVTAMTGLWYVLLGWLFFIGAIVWFVKTNGALNDYWRSKGARSHLTPPPGGAPPAPADTPHGPHRPVPGGPLRVTRRMRRRG
jgi:hypothetical protein